MRLFWGWALHLRYAWSRQSVLSLCSDTLCCAVSTHLTLNPPTTTLHTNTRRRAEEARREGIIAGERRKLLQQAAELAEFLPPGVLKNSEELEYVKQHTAQLRQRQTQQGVSWHGSMRY